MVKLSSNKIFELGEYITKFLRENGVEKESDLLIRVDKSDLKKIDEDLYYRNRKNEFFRHVDEKSSSNKGGNPNNTTTPPVNITQNQGPGLPVKV